MRKQIMFMTFLVLLSGCTKEAGTKFERNGAINFNGQLTSEEPSLSAKYETPGCSDKVPESIRYVLTDGNGETVTGESTIAVDGNNVVSTSSLSVPAGKYTVEDIALISSDETVVQRMPNALATGFDFTNFVSTSTPFDITVLGGEETTLKGDLLCYSVEEGNFGDAWIDGIFKIKELQTMYIRVAKSDLECVDRITVEIDGAITDTITVDGSGLYNTPVPAGLFAMVIRFFSGKEQLSAQTMIHTYNKDGILDSNDIIKFAGTCNGDDPEPAELFDYRDGGVVVWVDPDDSSRGLVVAIADQGQAPWGCEGTEVMAPDQDPNSLNHNGTQIFIGTGETNTANILFTCSEPGIAAELSDDYAVTVDGVLYDDWFLPSSELLMEMYTNKAAIDAAALANGGVAFSDDNYWSSSHANNDFLLIAWYQNFGSGGEFNGALKSIKFNVRSVRAF